MREFEARDLDSAFLLFNDTAVQKYLSPLNRRTREQMKFTLQNFSKRWRERGFGYWCISENNGSKMIGYCGFQYFDETRDVEISFAYFEDFWGRGYAAEAANAALKFGFEKLSLARVFGATHPQNVASRRVLEKLGMVFEKETTHYGIDTVTYSISCEDFAAVGGTFQLIYKNFIEQ